MNYATEVTINVKGQTLTSPVPLVSLMWGSKRQLLVTMYSLDRQAVVGRALYGRM